MIGYPPHLLYSLLYSAMFGFGKRKKPVEEPSTTEIPADSTVDNLASRLAKTRRGLGDSMADFFLGKQNIDQNTLDDLETSLLSADVGIETTTEIIDDLQSKLSRKALVNVDALQVALYEHMLDILQPCEQLLQVDSRNKPFVILVVGINGAGKTTSIGKLAHYYQQQGLSVMLAAGDTFRAAAVEQLQQWGSRNQVPVVAQAAGADPASVIFDAVQSGRSRNIDVVIADTAGRLHTQSNLMDELAKIKRVINKLDPDAPHETLLIMDAGIGQNALQQAEQFHRALGLTGVAVTKLDGTAKGGILFAIARKLALPIRFIGVGEGIEDLRPFRAREFVSALLED